MGVVTSTWTEPGNTATALLLLGRGSGPVVRARRRLPGRPAARPATPTWSPARRRRKAALGDRAFVLGHHYQRDEVIQFADVTGDSFKLAREAAARPERGVHRLLRRALHGRERRHPHRATHQKVILPDLAAGCSMADMAVLSPGREGVGGARATPASPTSTVPVTYMNSSADIKGFVGRNGGVVCTSSNAKRALDWAFERGQRVLFLPDQHLGRNTAVLEMGLDARRLRALRPAQARRRADRASSCATRR